MALGAQQAEGVPEEANVAKCEANEHAKRADFGRLLAAAYKTTKAIPKSVATASSPRPLICVGSVQTRSSQYLIYK